MNLRRLITLIFVIFTAQPLSSAVAQYNQVENLRPFVDICAESYIYLDGELDDITYDADERLLEIASEYGVRVGRSDCVRNNPSFDDQTVFVRYIVNAFTLGDGSVAYSAEIRAGVGTALLVDLRQFEVNENYSGFQSEFIEVYSQLPFYGSNTRVYWRTEALELAEASMREFAQDWRDSR